MVGGRTDLRQTATLRSGADMNQDAGGEKNSASVFLSSLFLFLEGDFFACCGSEAGDIYQERLRTTSLGSHKISAVRLFYQVREHGGSQPLLFALFR